MSTANPQANSSKLSLSPDTTSEFTTKCHYTLHLPSCGHKYFLSKPRIIHLCPVPPSHKTRCRNMASKPKEVVLDGVCEKCGGGGGGGGKAALKSKLALPAENGKGAGKAKEAGEGRKGENVDVNVDVDGGRENDRVRPSAENGKPLNERERTSFWERIRGVFGGKRRSWGKSEVAGDGVGDMEGSGELMDGDPDWEVVNREDS